mmetsp:Transcript_21714/g.71905  ORF Transcript_21714/g.71905 Transcript_21714/m.71905 type:complete len:257 (-) Transcript_21714:162-932(-)
MATLAAGRRGASARRSHEALVVIALAVLGPAAARLVMVHADHRAHLRARLPVRLGPTGPSSPRASPRLHLGHVSAAPRLYLGYTSAISRTSHESGHSFITASGLLTHSPASDQMAHCVALPSAHLTPSHTPHERGHSLYMKPGFLKHSPSAVQPGQSDLRSRQVDLQASQVTGQFRIMNSGLSLHSPADPQPGQSVCRSLHSGVQSPQLVGQRRSIDSGFCSHSPALAQAPHDSSVSLHVCVQMPHESGHCDIMNF